MKLPNGFFQKFIFNLAVTLLLLYGTSQLFIKLSTPTISSTVENPVATVEKPKEESLPLKTPPEPVKEILPAPVPETPPKPQPAPKPKVNKALPAAVEQYRSEVAKYPWPVDTALAVMACESGGNASIVSQTNDHGLFQLHNGLVSYGTAVYSPEANISLAYNNYYKTRGWQPWSAYKNGCYKKYLVN